MARYIGIDGYHTMILCDSTTAIALANQPEYPPLGFTYEVVDNLGIAGSSNITVSASAINGGTTSTLNTNYQKTTFEWVGTTWISK